MNDKKGLKDGYTELEKNRMIKFVEFCVEDLDKHSELYDEYDSSDDPELHEEYLKALSHCKTRKI
jgi:CCR4-NOT transcriptional regulation complex NOT5 subunit